MCESVANWNAYRPEPNPKVDMSVNRWDTPQRVTSALYEGKKPSPLQNTMAGFVALRKCDNPTNIDDCLYCADPRTCVLSVIKGLAPGQAESEAARVAYALEGAVPTPEHRMVWGMYASELERMYPKTAKRRESYYLPESLPPWVIALGVLAAIYYFNGH